MLRHCERRRAVSRLAGTYANDSLFIRAAFYFHITFTVIALLIGPFQFSKRIRSLAVNVHRWIGRIYVSSVAIGSVAAFIMSLVRSVALLEVTSKEKLPIVLGRGLPIVGQPRPIGADEHFRRHWQHEMSTWRQRNKRRSKGQGNWRLIRFADDFVLMVSGDRCHAETVQAEVSVELAPLGLQLAPEKTRVLHIDEGFDFLGCSIRRHRKRGTQKHYVLHPAVQESRAGNQRQGGGEDLQLNPQSGSGRVAPQLETDAGGVDELVPIRRGQCSVRHNRPPYAGPAAASDTP